MMKMEIPVMLTTPFRSNVTRPFHLKKERSTLSILFNKFI